MTKRRKPRLFDVYELDHDNPYSRTVAVVRYDGDPDVFTALVHRWLLREGHDETVEPPRPRLFRWNPDPTGTYGQILTEADRPGRGTWLGARVDFARRATGPVARRGCVPCDAFRGERHTEACAFGRREAAQPAYDMAVAA